MSMYPYDDESVTIEIIKVEIYCKILSIHDLLRFVKLLKVFFISGLD